MKKHHSTEWIRIHPDGQKLKFCLATAEGEQFLFYQRNYFGLTNHFRNGIRVDQIYHHKWGRNAMVDHVITKLPKYISYVRRYTS